MNSFVSMKKIIFLNILISFLAVPGCKTIEEAAEVLVYKDSLLIHSPDQMTIHFGKGKSFNHPTFVVWEEDMNGIYQRTLFITESYASGIFGYRMIGDSAWLDKRGTSYQPAALPYWTYKKGLIDNEFLIPTPEHPFVEDLKRKDFFVSTNFSQQDACRDNFIQRYAEACQVTAAFMEFLTNAVGLEW